MKRLAYNFAQLVYDRLISNNEEFITDQFISIEKFGDTEGDIEIRAELQPFIDRNDIVSLYDEEEITDKRWEDFCNVIKRLQINDLEDLLYSLNYNFQDRFYSKLPGENLEDYSVEYFNFRVTNSNDRYIDLKIEVKLER